VKVIFKKEKNQMMSKKYNKKIFLLYETPTLAKKAITVRYIYVWCGICAQVIKSWLHARQLDEIERV
jgi:hypothetical protein